MVIFRICLIVFQLYILVNLIIAEYMKKSIKKKINTDNETRFLLMIKLNMYFRYYIFTGLFHIFFLQKIKMEFINEFNKDMLDRELELLNTKKLYKGMFNVSVDKEEDEKIEEIKTKIRNYELRQKINKIKKRKSWIHIK